MVLVAVAHVWPNPRHAFLFLGLWDAGVAVLPDWLGLSVFKGASRVRGQEHWSATTSHLVTLAHRGPGSRSLC